MCGAFPTKRPRTSGSETRVRGKNGAVRRNGVVNKCCVLCKNDALDSNDVRHSAATPLQPPHRRATVSPSNLHGSYANFPLVSSLFAVSLGGARPPHVVIQRRWCRLSATICRCLSTVMGGP